MPTVLVRPIPAMRDVPVAPPTTVIEPPRGLHLGMAEMWHFRELLYFLIWRDIKVRYKQTVLGAGWAILQPLLSMVVFTVIFGGFAKIPSDGVPYPIFVYAGLLPWTLFSNAVSGAGVSLVNQTNLLTKIYFPRLFVPLANIGIAMADFVMSFAIYIGLMAWYHVPPGPGMLMLPVLLAVTTLAASGVGLFMAAVTVRFRDFRHLVPFMLQVWMYVSPVVYSINMVPAKYQWIMALNPIAGIIAGFRAALLNQPMPWDLLGISVVVSTVMLGVGLWSFQRTERRFADLA